MSERASARKPRGERRDGDGVASPLGTAIADVRRAPAPDDAPLARQVSQDWGAEREADRVADATSRSYAGPVLDGDRLSTGMQAAMTRAEPGLQRLSKVRFDQSDAAASAADSIDALAFTRGSDVAVAKGDLTPALAAHEATHAVQHDDGQVHAKLRGTGDALRGLGGTKTTKGIRKILPGAKTNWDKILSGVAAYEALEESLLKGGKPSLNTLNKAKPKLVATLTTISKDIAQWQSSNDQESADAWAEEKHAEAKKKGTQAEVDEREKAERRQAIAMLRPRVLNELNMLNSPDSKQWTDSLGLSASQITAEGREGEGQKNKVKELTYQTENGQFSGFFKAEKGFATKVETHEIDTGMRSVDPNYGARSVAMYKIDKLLNAGVTARAEFATHVDANGKTVLGTVLESAQGVQGGEAKFGMNKARAEQNGGIALDDPVLQRSLNKLQILDSICGQLDRHANNYYIQTDAQGNVTGITGIDLDMAFGQDMDAPDSRTANFAHNYKGFPGAVDEEFARALLRVDAKDVEEAITGLLKPAEVAATVKRFTWVQNKVREMQRNEKLVKEWGVKTVFEGAGYKIYKDTDFNSAAKNYQDSLLSFAASELKDSAQALVKSVIMTASGPNPLKSSLGARTFQDLPSETLMLFDRHLNAGSAVPKEVASWLYDNRMPERLEEFTMLVMNEALSETGLMDKFIVAVQELGEGVGSAGWTNDFSSAASKRWVPNAAKKLKAVKPSDDAKKQGRRSLLGSSRGKK